MPAPNTVILNFSPGVVTKGEPLGKKLFAVCFHATDGDEDAPTTKIWTELYRGATLNGTKKLAADDADAMDETPAHKMLDITTTVEHVLEIGVLR